MMTMPRMMMMMMPIMMMLVMILMMMMLAMTIIAAFSRALLRTRLSLSLSSCLSRDGG